MIRSFLDPPNGRLMLARHDTAPAATGTPIATATTTAAAGYAHGKIFGGLEAREIAAVPQPGAVATVPPRCPA